MLSSLGSLTRYVNVCKIPITLPSCQPFTLASILEYNTINHLDLPTNNFGGDINLDISNNGKERIRLTDINNNKQYIRLADINK